MLVIDNELNNHFPSHSVVDSVLNTAFRIEDSNSCKANETCCRKHETTGEKSAEFLDSRLQRSNSDGSDGV